MIVRGPAESPAPSPPPSNGPMSRRGADSGKARELVQQSVLAPLRSLFNSPGIARKLAGIRAEAYNVTSADDVADSDWFVARRTRAEPAESLAVPDTSAPWAVVAARLQGDRPVITIRDARGRDYWLTFDAPEYAELATATEVITARLYRAAGYHAPSVSIVTFDPASQLEAADTGSVREALARVPRRADGRARAAAHRVDGRPLGPFAFAGRRADDPADSVPHEHRRELRGLYVVAAWLNHTGLFRGTTLDVAVDSAGRASIRHYLSGFESSLGSSEGGQPKGARAGTEADWDAGKIVTRLVTFGFYAAAWERSAPQRFDPARWTPSSPNQAFAKRTVRDGFWGAKLVAACSEAELRAAVTAGQLSASAAAESLVQTLLSRRALTVRHWYAKVTPLDDIAVHQDSAGATLSFRDLAVVEGLASAERRRYEVRLALPARHWSHAESVALDLSAEGHGSVRLPPLGGAGPLGEIGWVELRAPPAGAAQPRAVRIYVLPDSATGYRIVGRRY